MTHRIASSLLLLLLPILALAQRLTPEQTGGVYYAYPVEEAPRIAIPEGFQLFYISHYGRHGSRWIDRKERYNWTKKQFVDDDNLTEAGKETKLKVKAICRNGKPHAGDLTPLGKEQHRRIARRMAQNYPEVFQGEDAVVTAQSSISGRCRASMLAFCKELRTLCPQLKVRPQTKKRFMAYISHDTEELKALTKRTKIAPKTPTDRFISNLFINPDAIKDPSRLIYELHTMASDMQDIPLPISLWDIFTYEEMMGVHDANNERMTITCRQHPDNEGIPARAALPLWEHIVETADEYIHNGQHGASLIFGHDTPLCRLMTLLQLSLPGDGMEDILPMGANLQILFMKNMSGEVYVAFLHNERQQFLPIKSKVPGFYRWDDVKSFVSEVALK